MSEYEGTADPFDYAKRERVQGNLCICGEDLGEPFDGIAWQDWEQCPNCELHVKHAGWIDDMVKASDRQTARIAHLEHAMSLEESWDDEIGSYTFFADFVVAENARLEETNKGLFKIIEAYHPEYLDGCSCPQCGDMPVYVKATEGSE